MHSCKDVSRRDFLKLSLVPLLDTRKKLKPVVLVWLDGGISQIESFDAKPESMSEIRGEWGAIRTKCGAVFSDRFPKLAASEHLTVLRAVQSKESSHPGGNAEFMGTPPMPRQHKVGGVGYSFVKGSEGFSRVEDGHHSNSSDLLIEWDLNEKRFRPPCLDLSIEKERMVERRALLGLFQKEERNNALAFDLLLGGGTLQEAFDLPEKERERYGNSQTGDAILLAKRLAERGSGFTTVYNSHWDHHYSIFQVMDARARQLDQALACLMEETHGEIISAAYGDFGRTPKVNAGGGRDHFPNAQTALLSGNGLVYGSTNKYGEAKDGIVTPERLRKTVLARAGGDYAANEVVTAAL